MALARGTSRTTGHVLGLGVKSLALASDIVSVALASENMHLVLIIFALCA